MKLDRIDLVHALCQQIPDAGTHMVRYREAAYSNRKRGELVEVCEALAAGEDPLLCPRCDVEMEIVAWITKPSVIDADPRAPPRAAG